jgi:CDP-6-deoxy-D-xylo-4-hexulose-3-dehydrase
MADSSFAADFRVLLAKHNIDTPRFAHSARAFDPAKPQVLYSGPVYDADELVAATAALCEGKWSVNGEYVNRFERAFSAYLNQRGSVMVNSGSSADLLMVAACKACFGWKDGDGIIVSPVGFPTTISAITLNGLRPVFVDIEWETLNADNDLIEKQLAFHAAANDFPHVSLGGPSPVRAILVSPVLGNPPDIDRLVALSERYGVKLLMDGCDSLGSTWRGKHLTEYATATTCSFFPSHHVSVLQGGMVSSNDTELLDLVRSMAAWGKDCWCTGSANLLPNGCCGKRFDCWLKSQPEVVVDHRYVYTTDRAYNLQPLDLQGALGLAQMGKIEDIHELRHRHACTLRLMLWQTLNNYGNGPVQLVYETAPHCLPSWFGVPIICPTYAFKRALVAHLEAAGIQTRNYFAGNILLHDAYAHLGRATDYPNANEVLKRVFFLGCHPGLTEAHFAHIEATLKTFTPPTPCTSTD